MSICLLPTERVALDFWQQTIQNGLFGRQWIRGPAQKGWRDHLVGNHLWTKLPRVSWFFEGHFLENILYSICKYFVGEFASRLVSELGLTGSQHETGNTGNTGNIGCLKIRRFGGLYLLGKQGRNGIGIIADNGRNSLLTPKPSHEKGREIQKGYINNTICEIAWNLTSDVLHRTVLYIEKNSGIYSCIVYTKPILSQVAPRASSQSCKHTFQTTCFTDFCETLFP